MIAELSTGNVIAIIAACVTGFGTFAGLLVIALRVSMIAGKMIERLDHHGQQLESSTT